MGIFGALTNLEELYVCHCAPLTSTDTSLTPSKPPSLSLSRLDNNKLTQVSASLISSNVKLKAVYVHATNTRCFLPTSTTILIPCSFRNPCSHLERNDIRQIPVGFLSGLTALEEV